jgi:hypothetical protein
MTGMENNQQATPEMPRPALPLLALLALASALGVASAIILAGLTMLLAAPAYADDGSLLLERRGKMAEARLVFAETESYADGDGVRTRVLEEYANPFAEQLAGIYLHRLPGDAVLEQLTFTRVAQDGELTETPVEARHALLTLRKGAGLVQPTAQIGPGETLLVELEYRAGTPRRVLAAR